MKKAKAVQKAAAVNAAQASKRAKQAAAASAVQAPKGKPGKQGKADKKVAKPGKPGKLTRRNATAANAVWRATGKNMALRAPHVVAAWDALVKLLPASTEKLCKLPALDMPNGNSRPSFLSYMQRRGYLEAK